MGGDRGTEDGSQEVSDLIGVQLTLALMAWFLATLACFFFVGVIVGLILVFAGLVGFGWFLVSAVRSADIEN